MDRPLRLDDPRLRAAWWWVSCLAPVVVAAALTPVRASFAPADSALVLVLVVVAVAAVGQRGPGVLAAVMGALSFDFFLTAPYQTLAISDRDDVETAVLLILVGLAVSELALSGRRQQSSASRRKGYLDGLVEAGHLVATGDTPPKAMVEFVERQVVATLGVSRCQYVAGPLGAHPRLHPDGTVRRGDTVLAVDHGGLPVDDVIEVPVTSGGRVFGRLVLTASGRTVWTTVDQRLVVCSMADQLGLSLAQHSDGFGGARNRG